MKSKSILILCALVVVFACQPDKMNHQAQIKPSPISSPSAQASVLLPSAEPRSSTGPEPTPVPTPSAFPAELLGKTYYTPKFPCKEIQSSDISNPVLIAPRDIAVTSDGKEIYVTLKNASSLQTDRKNRPIPVERSYVYRIKFYKPDDSTLSVVNTNQEYSFTCGFNGEIEMTPDSKLLMSYPEMDNQMMFLSNQAPIVAHHFYLLDLIQFKTQKFATRQFKPILLDALKYGWADARSLVRLSHAQSGNILYLLATSNLYEPHRVEKWQKQDNRFEEIVKLRGYSSPISLLEKSEKMLAFYHKSYAIPILNAPRDPEDMYLPNSQVQCSKIKSSDTIEYTGNAKLDSKGNAYFTGQIFTYDGTLKSSASFIWKQTPDNQITCIAGNGKNGYLDGKGLEASFNQPSELDLDAAGNIYVADTGNNAIRKITPDGKVTTLYRAPEQKNP